MSLHTLLGAMSGTSMDGLDLALCTFQSLENETYTHTVLAAKTYEYPLELLSKLRRSNEMSALELVQLDKELGAFFADRMLEFVKTHQQDWDQIDAIASHGHTVHHQPEQGFTVQIGCGETIAFKTGKRVINDFRQKDVIAGGQGAPLVPIGDQLLYQSRAEAFLNLGGFANISFRKKTVIAFDICPANLPLNRIAEKLGQNFDADGAIARSGTVDSKILAELNALTYYSEKPPKSLGTEWLNGEFMHLLEQIDNAADQMRTAVEHISDQISVCLNQNGLNSVFITGGGARNSYLTERIQEKTRAALIIPSENDIDFKEAIIFGLLGTLYLDGKTNTLASVTGASRNVIGGVLHLP